MRQYLLIDRGAVKTFLKKLLRRLLIHFKKQQLNSKFCKKSPSFVTVKDMKMAQIKLIGVMKLVDGGLTFYTVV